MDQHLLKVIVDCRGRAKWKRSSDAHVSTWMNREWFDGSHIEALNVVIATRGCKWYEAGGCSMCGYSNESLPEGQAPDIAKQIEVVKKRYGSQPVVKVFTSGSFFDERELTAEERTLVIEGIKDLLKTATAGNDKSAIDHASAGNRRKTKFIVESRPEHISEEKLNDAIETLNADKEAPITLEVAIGLESANDRVLRDSINKGFDFASYKKAAQTIIASGARLKTYLMLKPPFLTEAQAIEDCVASVRALKELGLPQTISINPMNIQAFTLVEQMFDAGEYRPPWLWSVVEVLKQAKQITGSDHWLLCHPSAGGKARGTHNCGKCDEVVLEAISDFSLTNDVTVFDGIECPCKKEHRAALIELQ